MNWDFTRGLIYAGSLAAMLLSMFGWISFDPATGAVTVPDFNLYDVLARIGGLGSGLGLLAIVKGWGGRR